MPATKRRFTAPCRSFLVCALLVGLGSADLGAQDVLTLQLQQGFGKNKVRYRDFKWEILESEHLELHFEPEFQDLAVEAIECLEEAYDHISEILHHELSHRPPVVIYQSHYQFQQTNIYPAFLPPGVAGFAEPLRFRMVIPFDGDLDEFRNVLVHELCHIFQYDIVHKGPIRRISSPIAQPPTWIMEGMAEYVTPGRNTIDEMVLRDAILTDGLIPLETMNGAWGQGNVFLAYKQSHAIMEYIAEHYGPEKISRILRLWDSRNDTDKLLDRLIGLDMKTLGDRWSAQMRKSYWPLLQTRDYISEFAEEIGDKDESFQSFSNARWSLSGDMLATLSSDGVEQHVDIIRLTDASLVERVTRSMRAAQFDHLSIGSGTVAWAPDGHTIAFVAKEGPRDRIMLWDLYDKELGQTLTMPDLELIESLAWAPDSRQLAFIGTGYGQSDLYVIDIETGERQQLTGTPQREDHPNWSPDGQSLAYSAKYRHQFDIKAYDFATGTAHTIVASPTDDLWPQWLPEGNKLLFVSTRDKINDLFVYHLDEGREYRLTRSLSGIMNPALSPDGRQIVFSTYFKGRSHLYLMDMPEWPGVKRKDAELLARVADVATIAVAADVAVAP
ncbi:MAG: peptidase MA family metallohydrolase, partial [Candidatus Latescibacteria bacterium]|nr:peptidase MA family metallohydrolase [Candidatus Latescibacterota bacterium]